MLNAEVMGDDSRGNMVEIRENLISGRSVMEPIFELWQETERYRAARRNLYVGLLDMEKAYSRVPRKAI